MNSHPYPPGSAGRAHPTPPGTLDLHSHPVIPQRGRTWVEESGGWWVAGQRGGGALAVGWGLTDGAGRAGGGGFSKLGSWIYYGGASVRGRPYYGGASVRGRPR